MTVSVLGKRFRDFIPSGIKSALARRLCSESIGTLVGAVFRNQIPSWECRIDTSSPRVQGRTKAAILWRLYESGEIRFIRSHLRADLDVIEVGGSLGVVSCHIRDKINSERRLVVVEADPELATIVEGNLRGNHPNKQFEVLNRAVSYHPHGDGRVRFARNPASISGRLARGLGEEDVVEVVATTLGELTVERQIGEFVLVSDIEGSEVELLVNDADILRSNCRQMIIELHDTLRDGNQISVDDLVYIIKELGFVLDARHGAVCVFSTNSTENKHTKRTHRDSGPR